MYFCDEELDFASLFPFSLVLNCVLIVVGPGVVLSLDKFSIIAYHYHSPPRGEVYLEDRIPDPKEDCRLSRNRAGGGVVEDGDGYTEFPCDGGD